MFNYCKKIFKVLLSYTTCLCKRNKNKVVIGGWFGNKFSDNGKFLYKTILQDNKIRPIWITKNANVYNDMVKMGYEVYLTNSFKGIYHQLTSSSYFTCTGKDDVSYYLFGNSKHIELWHGIPLKKIMYDDKINNIHKIYSKKNIYRRFIAGPGKKNYYVVSTSDKISEIYESAFNIKKENILQLGQARNDVFFNDSIEDRDFNEEFKNKKVILYMPTHRNEGKTEINIDSIFDLDRLNEICKKNNSLFLIKKHYYHNKEKSGIDSYSNILDITNEEYDSQMLLKYTDILITDYSSCYIDYLLLDRPIIFYNFDYENYIMNDREMYFEYDLVTPGNKATTYDELEKELISLMEEKVDLFTDSRKEIRNLFYSVDNQNIVSDKIINNIIKN